MTGFKPKTNERQLQPLRPDVKILDLTVNDIFNGEIIPIGVITDPLFHILGNNYSGRESLFVATPKLKCLNFTDLNSAIEAMRYHR